MFMIFFKLLTGNLFGVKEENNENLSQDSLSSGRDSYLKYTKQESQRLHYGFSTIQVNIYMHNELQKRLYYQEMIAAQLMKKFIIFKQQNVRYHVHKRP
jgi:hypothetical protein